MVTTLPPRLVNKEVDSEILEIHTFPNGKTIRPFHGGRLAILVGLEPQVRTTKT